MTAAYNSGRRAFTLEDILAQTQCWNCRGFGHARSGCTSSEGSRAVGFCIHALQASAEGKGKGKGKDKGKGKGRGGGGRGRAAAVRGSGAIAAYIEDDHTLTLLMALIWLLTACQNE